MYGYNTRYRGLQCTERFEIIPGVSMAYNFQIGHNKIKLLRNMKKYLKYSNCFITYRINTAEC
jgi:hypothetical protein